MAQPCSKSERMTADFCRALLGPRPARALRSSDGFTLLEAVFAAFIVGIAAVGLLMMFSTGQTFVQASGTDRISAQLAQQRIEEVRATGYGTKFPPDPRAETIWTAVPGNPGYERTTIITDVCATNFTLVWNDGGCTPATSEAQARLVVVTVRALNNNAPLDDPQTTRAVLQTVLVRR